MVKIGKELIIRNCTESDIAQIAGIISNKQYETVLKHGKTEDEILSSFKAKFEHANSAKAELLVAESDGEVVGYAASIYAGRNAHCEVGVTPASLRQRIAYKLVIALMDRLKGKEIEKIVAICGVNNEASQRLAEKTGFEFIGDCKYGGREFKRFEIKL